MNMRALIRGTEICLENAWTKWQRMNMLFLTGKEKDADGNPLPGDGWTLVGGYVPPEPMYRTPIQEKPVEQSAESEGTVTESPSTRSSESEGTVTESLPETVSYGGKEYTLEELKKLIG